MTFLDVPVPPQLEQVIGWPGGDARWLSLCWTCCGDCPWIEDGRSSMTGHSWGLLAWWRHPAVAPTLKDCDVGSSEADGTQRLLIDRRCREVFLADVAEARAVVRGQWPAEPVFELSPEEWEAVVERVRQAVVDRPIPTLGDLMRQIREHDRLVAAMKEWLDR